MEELTELQKQTLKVAQLSMDELPKTHLQLCQMIWAAYEAGEKVSQMQLPVKPACENCEKYFNKLLDWIRDDIEFGYSSDMILNKIKHKNYDINHIDLNSKSV